MRLRFLNVILHIEKRYSSKSCSKCYPRKCTSVPIYSLRNRHFFLSMTRSNSLRVPWNLPCFAELIASAQSPTVHFPHLQGIRAFRAISSFILSQLVPFLWDHRSEEFNVGTPIGIANECKHSLMIDVLWMLCWNSPQASSWREH